MQPINNHTIAWQDLVTPAPRTRAAREENPLYQSLLYAIQTTCIDRAPASCPQSLRGKACIPAASRVRNLLVSIVQRLQCALAQIVVKEITQQPSQPKIRITEMRNAIQTFATQLLTEWIQEEGNKERSDIHVWQAALLELEQKYRALIPRTRQTSTQ